MKELKEGQKAPAFSLKNQDGEKVSLSDYKGKKVILYFYPKDMTPGCTQQACEFSETKSKFSRKKTVVLGVSKDSVERHKKFEEKHDLKIPLLSDENSNVCEKYGVWQEKKLYGKSFMGIVRTTFIIDENGKIEKIFPKVRVKNHLEDVLLSI